MSDKILMDIDTTKMRFEYSGTDTIPDVEYLNSGTYGSELLSVPFAPLPTRMNITSLIIDQSTHYVNIV